MKAPISLCLIVRDEPFLENCLLSIRDYVQEIIIVDTGSINPDSIKIAQKYADKFEIFTECNNPDTGLIENFSLARQKSFDLATQPWVMWCDADDLIVGGENLVKIIQSYDTNQYSSMGIMFPYEYSYNEKKQATCIHYRERLFFNKNNIHWTNPVHELIVSNEGINCPIFTRDDVIFKHQRQYIQKDREPNRNLRILRKYIDETGTSDARLLYYLGLECYNAGLLDEAITHLVKYIELSGWDDERAMACLKLIDIYQSKGQYNEAIKWGFKAIALKEIWSEGYFAIGKMFYYLALQGGAESRRHWERCTNFIKIGLNLPPTKTLLFINPLDRAVEIHRYLNMALNKLGDVSSALQSVEMALQTAPQDANLLLNKKLYEEFLIKQEIDKNLKKLKEINPGAINLFNDLTYEAGSNFPIANTSNNADLWNIPSTYNFDGLPIRMTDQQLQALVILVWKQFMLHDELMSAISFLENAPYNVRHSVATERALANTKACLAWMDDKHKFQTVNAPECTEFEVGVPLPGKILYAAGHRFDFVAERLAPHSSLVDFGSMDGGFTNRYGLLGHKVVGLDVCQTSVSLANKKAAEFNTGAEHICTYFQDCVDKVPNNYFDYATSTDTYEHIKDPVKDMFLPAKKMLNENGKFLLCTPHGAWMRGYYLEWAHPWIYGRSGIKWLNPFPRAHLIAPTVWTVAEHFRKAGFWVKDCFVDFCENSYKDVPGQGNVFAEAHIQHPHIGNALDIVFYVGASWERWTPETFKKTGLGGSETMLIEQSKRLAALGHKVRVYKDCENYSEGIYDGVEYYDSSKYHDLTCDVLIVSRNAFGLSDQHKIDAKLKLLWVHDVYALNATNELLLKADKILALSQWHKENLIKVHNVHPDHIVITRNGIDITMFNKDIVKNNYKCLNSSSPDRSWSVLLDMWPRIKKQVPQAELHLFYGFKNWEISAQNNVQHQQLIQEIKNKIHNLKDHGVIFHDRVNQQELINEMMSAGTYLYPTWFSETFFISGAQAQMAGLRIISSPIAAIKEIVDDRGVLIPGEWTSPAYQEKFIGAAVKALKKKNNKDRLILQKYAEEHFGLDSLAQEWEKMFYQLIEEKQSNPLIPYLPTVAYT